MTIAIVAGARPNFMKIAPVMRALAGYTQHRVILVHTGQHYDAAMSGAFFDDLGIPRPDVNLNVGSGSHAEQTGRVMVGFETFCIERRPDWTIVVGDVNSTLACAITAKKQGVRLAHVEAGLRSRDMSMPEEINRLCTDAIADLLFTTDAIANQNLLQEGHPESKIRLVGNTMIDTLFRHIGKARCLSLPDGLTPRGYAVLTLHRPVNVDSPQQLDSVLRALDPVADRMPVMFPVHPRTAMTLREVALHHNFRTSGPLGYMKFLSLVANSKLVLTDSGGLQEETTALGIPCVTLRSNTERPITCQIGTNILAGSDPAGIRKVVEDVLATSPRPYTVPPLWDGRAGERIAACLASLDHT